MTQLFKTWRSRVAFGALACAIAGVPVPRGDAAEAIVLSAFVEVDVPDLDLSHLLPSGTPDALRELAGGVTLGRSPQLGYVRTLTRHFIENQLRGFPELAAAIEAPGRVLVRRRAYPVLSTDVAGWVEGALEEAGCTGLLPLASSALIVPAGVSYPDPEPAFEVLGVDIDSLRSEIQVRLRVDGPGGQVPFFVTVPVPPNVVYAQNSDACAFRRPGVAIARAPESATHPSGPILARAGEPATLQAVGRGLMLLMTVVPLENGRKGEVVRVRNTDTEGIVTATVIGADLLERGF